MLFNTQFLMKMCIRDSLCFEEDCDAQVALRELMDKKMIQAPAVSYTHLDVYKRQAIHH